MRQRQRRLIATIILMAAAIITLLVHPDNYQSVDVPANDITTTDQAIDTAVGALATLEVKGRAAKTGYDRDQFGNGWARTGGCDTRNIILARDMQDVVANECRVLSGVLNDPYTGNSVVFVRGPSTSDEVQIDHVVALSNAWQTGAAYWQYSKRLAFANDPLELLAVDGDANQAKSDGDAATWLPSNKPFRCQYVARQVAVKKKYQLWMTQAEHDAIFRVLQSCPAQGLPVGYPSVTLDIDA